MSRTLMVLFTLVLIGLTGCDKLKEGGLTQTLKVTAGELQSKVSTKFPVKCRTSLLALETTATGGAQDEHVPGRTRTKREEAFG